jgi:hypothetical protein
MVGLDPAVLTKFTNSFKDSSLSALVSFLRIMPTSKAF